MSDEGAGGQGSDSTVSRSEDASGILAVVAEPGSVGFDQQTHNEPNSSYRQILRSSSITGGASVLNIGIGLFRTKVAAVLLGPAGIGLIGLLQNLMATAATVTALGFGTSGTREIAEATGRGDRQGVASARRSLFWGTLALSVIGGAAIWAARSTLAARVLDDPALASEVGWLGLGVALTVASGSQGALLTGMRRIGDAARVSVFSAALSTALGVGSLWLWGSDALIAYVIAAPFASFILGHVYVARLPKPPAVPTPLSKLIGHWRLLAQLGAAFMVAGLAKTGAQLAVRTLVQHELGPEALGQLHAAMMISVTYVGFVLTAMGKDYYPRLAASMGDPAVSNRMINEQTEVALLLAGPVLLAVLVLAPWVVELLYTSQFADAATVLRWQVIGDVLKVATWPLGFAIAAAAEGRNVLIAESLGAAVLMGLTWLAIPLLGVEAAGLGFVGMYLAVLPLVYGLARRRTGFRWEPRVFRYLAILLSVFAVLGVLAASSLWLGLVLGLIALLTVSAHSLSRLLAMADRPVRLRQLTAFSQRLWNESKRRNG